MNTRIKGLSDILGSDSGAITKAEVYKMYHMHKLLFKNTREKVIAEHDKVVIERKNVVNRLGRLTVGYPAESQHLSTTTFMNRFRLKKNATLVVLGLSVAAYGPLSEAPLVRTIPSPAEAGVTGLNIAKSILNDVDKYLSGTSPAAGSKDQTVLSPSSTEAKKQNSKTDITSTTLAQLSIPGGGPIDVTTPPKSSQSTVLKAQDSGVKYSVEAGSVICMSKENVTIRPDGGSALTQIANQTNEPWDQGAAAGSSQNTDDKLWQEVQTTKHNIQPDGSYDLTVGKNCTGLEK